MLYILVEVLYSPFTNSELSAGLKIVERRVKVSMFDEKMKDENFKVAFSQSSETAVEILLKKIVDELRRVSHVPHQSTPLTSQSL